MELWTLTHSGPRNALAVAMRAEAAGWDGMLVVDSQNLAPDSYVALTLAATGTDRIGLGTGVTNSVTRHPAVTASAAMAVQDVSNGRMVLGIGRGDSALAHLGRSPARFAGFRRYLETLQHYLRGEPVEFSDIPMPDDIATGIAALELADHPTTSRILWHRGDLAKVPVEVAATGPRVIEAAGQLADRVMFTLGAVSERIDWGIALATRARRARGLEPAGIRFGAYVNVVCHPDAAIARQLVRGGLTTFARFSVMHGETAGPVSDSERSVLESLHDGYNMRAHTRADSEQAELMSDAFIDRFAIAGPPEHCVARLNALKSLGLDKVVISGPTAGADPSEARRAMKLLDEEVLPVFSRASQ
jgi:5,10-methylenetetrahydromethanopterin reductase